MNKYQTAVASLLSIESEELFQKAIRKIWNTPKDYPKHGILFKYVSPTGEYYHKGVHYGCLTQIRHQWDVAYTPDLTAAILEDTRIPTLAEGITRQNLPVFAEWQEKIDKYFADLAE